MTRSQNSFFNMVTSIGSSILLIVLSFITRTVFIRTLGTDYLGLEGVFSNILTVLSLANLGFDTAIAYKLYRPIEEGDRRRIQLLMKLYRQVYLVVGFVIAGLGLCLIPFLPYLAKDYDRLAQLGLNGVLIFLLYLFNTVSSYWFFAYKNAFVKATQKSYILTVAGYVIALCNSACQILVLIFTRNFVLYLLTQIGFTVLQNLLNAIICDRRHPYLREKTDERISRQEVRSIFKDCSVLLLHLVSGTVINSSDILVLSAMAGLETVGLYSQYLLVKNQISSLLAKLVNSLQASLGSLYSTGNLEWSRLAFRAVNFFTVWLFGVGAIGMAVLMDEFIRLWAGPQFVVTSWTTAAGVTVRTPLAVLIGVEFYIAGQGHYLMIFREVTAAFRYLRLRPLASIAVNLILSILLVPKIGIAGCVVSTIIAHQFTYLLVDPWVIWRRALQTSPWGYYLRNILYRLVIAAAGVLCWWLCARIPTGGVAGFILRGCVCALVPGVLFPLCFCRTQEFRFFTRTARELLGRYMPGGAGKGGVHGD